MRFALATLALLLVACGSKQQNKPAPVLQSSAPATAVSTSDSHPAAASAEPYTDIIVHDVILHENSNLKLKVRWLRGRMYRTRAGIIPSLDVPDSFTLDISDGVIGTSLTDLSAMLNESVLKGSSLHDVRLSVLGKQLEMKGVLQKVVPIPVQMLADVGASGDGNHVRIHVAKLDVLTIPVKSLLGALKINAADLIDVKKTRGIRINGNDIDIDTSEILPPPRNTGKLSDVHISKSGDLVEVYGSARLEVTRMKRWRNFIRLRGGTVNLGKLTMTNTDILVADRSQADWFNFDLVHYSEQLVNGQTRITPEAGLEIVMPDITKIPKTPANQRISMQWLKNRSVPPPLDVP